MNEASRRKSSRSKKSVDYSRYNRYLSDSDEDDEFVPRKKEAVVGETDKKRPLPFEEARKPKVKKQSKVITLSDDEEEAKEAGEDPTQSSDSSHCYSPLPPSSSQEGHSLTPRERLPLSPLKEKETETPLPQHSGKHSLQPTSHDYALPLERTGDGQENRGSSLSPLSPIIAPVSSVKEKMDLKSTEKASPAKQDITNASKKNHLCPSLTLKSSIPKWTPPGPAGTQQSLGENRPHLGLRIGLSRNTTSFHPLHPKVKSVTAGK